MEKISFPFQKEVSEIFGIVHRPVAEVAVWSFKRKGWIKIVALVDTGADYTLLPSYFIPILGVDLKRDCHVHSTSGIGGTMNVCVFEKMPLRIGNWQHQIPVGFLKQDNIPPLLGRQECLEKMGVWLYKKRTTFILDVR